MPKSDDRRLTVASECRYRVKPITGCQKAKIARQSGQLIANSYCLVRSHQSQGDAPSLVWAIVVCVLANSGLKLSSLSATEPSITCGTGNTYPPWGIGFPVIAAVRRVPVLWMVELSATRRPFGRHSMCSTLPELVWRPSGAAETACRRSLRPRIQQSSSGAELA